MNELRRFLTALEPEVIVLSGRRGEGKTVAWDRALAESRSELARDTYAYVSLSGLPSLDALKQAVVENTIGTAEIGSRQTLVRVAKNASAALSKLHRGLPAVLKLPWVQRAQSLAGRLWFRTVRDRLICIDDFERLSDTLNVRDLFVLISFLKERRNCKVALIVGDEALHDKRLGFERYLETAVKSHVRFPLTAEEAPQVPLGITEIASGITGIASVKFDPPLSAWTVPHHGSLRLGRDGHLIYADGTGEFFHIFWVSDDAFRNKRLRVTLRFKPAATCSTNLCLHKWGGWDICLISPAGQVLYKGTCESVDVRRAAGGFLLAEIVYWNHDHDHVVGIGTAMDRGVYPGHDRDQFIFSEIRVESIDYGEKGSVPERERITFVDVGARDGLPPSVAALGQQIRPIMVEPEPEAAALLSEQAMLFDGGKVVDYALSDRAERRTLYVTQVEGCSSVLRPNADLLQEYPIEDWFKVRKEIEVDCVTYADLYERGIAPQPDIIKIDVQGFEYEVLQGFGDLLQDCIGVELEAHSRQLYVGQKLLTDLTTLLDRYDFRLYQLAPQAVTYFNGELIEFNAFFFKKRSWPGYLDPVTAAKRDRFKKVWDVTS